MQSKPDASEKLTVVISYILLSVILLGGNALDSVANDE